MNLVTLATSRWGPKLAVLLCRVLSRSQAYRLGRWLASLVAGNSELAFVSALRANMAVVRGLPEEHPQVDQAVTRLLQNTVCTYIDLFRAVMAGPETVCAACQFDQSLLAVVQECRDSGRGLVLVGAHTCSFDILLLALSRHFPSVQVLSNANPKGSSGVMNDLRVEQGLNVTPISLQSLRQAVEGLRRGGVVAIAADVPVETGEELTFFGRRSRLPVGHSRLALGTGARMMVSASHRVGRGIYRAEVTLIPQPVGTGDRKRDVVRWAQSSLSAIEGLIRQWPDEWLMPQPLWDGAAPSPVGGRTP